MQLGRAGALAILLASVSSSIGPAWAAASGDAEPHRTAARQDEIVLQWNEVALEAIRRSALGPPIVARALAILHTCMYDAWAAYDRVASGTQLGVSLRQPRYASIAPITSGRRSALPLIARSSICFRRSRHGSTT